MPLLFRKRTVLAKIETVSGTDSVPTGAANAILTKNLSVTPMVTNFVSRDIVRPTLGNFTQIPASIYAKMDFEVELAGAGAAGTAPGYGPLLRACGLSETVSAGVSVTYAPVSGGFESITLYFNVDGVLHRLTGARGSVTIMMSVFGIPTYKFSFLGIYNAVTDTAAPTVVLTVYQTPLAVNNTNTTGLTLHGYAGSVLSDLSLDVGVKTAYRSLVGGSQAIQLTDRLSVGSATVEATTIAAKDWFTPASTGALSTLAITHGTTAGNKIVLTAPQVQIQSPAYSEKDMITMIQLQLVLLPSGAANDEISIVIQ